MIEGRIPRTDRKTSSDFAAIIPPQKVRYLADIADTVRRYHAATDEQVGGGAPSASTCGPPRRRCRRPVPTRAGCAEVLEVAEQALPAEAAAELLDEWPAVVEAYSGDEMVVTVRDRELHTQLTRETLSGNQVRRVALPTTADHGELLRFLRRENLPGKFPFTAGVFAFKREGEDPARMFAGEGDAFRTNRRFKYLSEHSRRSGCRRRSTR